MKFDLHHDVTSLTLFITMILISLGTIQFLNLKFVKYLTTDNSLDIVEVVNESSGDDHDDNEVNHDVTRNPDDTNENVTSTLNPLPKMEDTISMASGWRCACKGGFLPPGLLKSFGGAEAVMLLGMGQCYHSKAS
jgi:hypothetical protein